MATTFWLLIGYNFGCVIAIDMMFNSNGGFLGSSYPMMIAEIEDVRDVAIIVLSTQKSFQVQIHSVVPQIFHTQTKKHRLMAPKQNLPQFTACANNMFCSVP